MKKEVFIPGEQARGKKRGRNPAWVWGRLKRNKTTEGAAFKRGPKGGGGRPVGKRPSCHREVIERKVGEHSESWGPNPIRGVVRGKRRPKSYTEKHHQREGEKKGRCVPSICKKSILLLGEGGVLLT